MTAGTGTSTWWLTPENRARKRIVSLPSSRSDTARTATFRTTWPSLIAPGGTRTPAIRASTSRYGVNPLSEIQSYIARTRYGRFELIFAEDVIAGRRAEASAES